MTKEALLAMDPNILVSLINMKLRDSFNSLDDYCEDIGVKPEEIFEIVKVTGRVYDSNSNQFK